MAIFLPKPFYARKNNDEAQESREKGNEFFKKGLLTMKRLIIMMKSSWAGWWWSIVFCAAIFGEVVHYKWGAWFPHWNLESVERPIKCLKSMEPNSNGRTRGRGEDGSNDGGVPCHLIRNINRLLLCWVQAQHTHCLLKKWLKKTKQKKYPEFDKWLNFLYRNIYSYINGCSDSN